MKKIYKLYAVIEPEPGIFCVPWFQNTETLMM